MFIDNNGNLQFESIEELKLNKDLAIKEFAGWTVPSIEEIQLRIVEGIEDIIDSVGTEAFGTTSEDVVSNILYIMKMAIEMSQSIIDDIGDNNVTKKFNDYANRFYLACDLVQQQLTI
jgi:hypothetical protein